MRSIMGVEGSLRRSDPDKEPPREGHQAFQEQDRRAISSPGVSSSHPPPPPHGASALGPSLLPPTTTSLTC